MKTISEGKAVIGVPDESLTKKSETFYNPAMEHQRDITIAALKVAKPKDVLDPLAATGIRGVRIIKEVDGVEKVVFNDANPSAIKLIKNNIKLNKIKKSLYKIHEKNAVNLFVEKGRYDFVDIDPFGSPITFLRNVGSTLHKGSLLGVTATDSGALAGKFAKACFRRYGVFVKKTDFPKELGIRVLITSTMQNLANHNFTFEPLYCHANHYFRIIGRVEYGPDRNLDKIKIISYCPNCHNKVIEIENKCNNCKEKMYQIGPIWTSKIQDKEFCKKMISEFDFKGNKEIVNSIQEIDEPFYYDMHAISKSTKKAPPKIDKLIEKLKSKGFEASRTHMCLTGIKTNAGIKDILRFLR
ncbi:MAG: tRNA (guanine(10)-N(2))-dimethyltransferase [Candidatus Aenigmarchaeota archaeon]|nr:tRNA (guanine(10)-N(2))-dimethyltransferase [Candidatus Aenigmarchaeota archaeon]